MGSQHPTTASQDTQDIGKLWDMIKGMRFGMFTTRHENGHLHSRPMTTQNRRDEEADALWFFMSRSSEPFADVQREQQVNVAYADTSSDTYVSVSGLAEAVKDPQLRRALWNTPTQAWFPNGPDDPDVVLVRVRITHAEYWDVKESKPVQLYKMARAALTGQPPKDMGDHGQVRMH
ncbi:pyridoxamine 5'-phosphate oxidase family protein [Azohydromonas caseinilytica]|uniref:Pyridoxamine 5'-phosphate oxidase family protein n=1 Tax=Azohydromonas caseinilytica TaxID=2728836 RepID=A0A848FJ58_9BURK|nr:pyridoxamine 5'-phosphate oxidase family protein [Azohydromonas caseinilytica]NML17861.1 pyridoxamine 5'-phosphate oxidase family protein [Azohydromonas caseinilytica]